MYSSSIISITALASLMPMAMAACASGELGVVYRWAPQYTGGAAQLTLYSGSVVGNDCKIKSSNGLTQNTNQWCRGGYDQNFIVDCQGGSAPVTLRDNNGVNYRCHSTSDKGCNLVGFQLGVCCSRV